MKKKIKTNKKEPFRGSFLLVSLTCTHPKKIVMNPNQPKTSAEIPAKPVAKKFFLRNSRRTATAHRIPTSNIKIPNTIDKPPYVHDLPRNHQVLLYLFL